MIPASSSTHSFASTNDEAMKKKRKAFCRKIDTNTEDYETVLRKIKNFLFKPFVAAVADNNLTECWISSVNDWQKTKNSTENPPSQSPHKKKQKILS